MTPKRRFAKQRAAHWGKLVIHAPFPTSVVRLGTGMRMCAMPRVVCWDSWAIGKPCPTFVAHLETRAVVFASLRAKH